MQNLNWKTFAIIGAIIVGLVLIWHTAGGKLKDFIGEPANVKVSFHNLVVITLLAVVGILGLKYLFVGKVHVPGVSEAAAAV